MKNITISLIVLFSINNALAAQTGPYTSKISMLQITDIDNPYHNVFLVLDITNSPCDKTNSNNRFAIVNDVQYSAILAALMSDKEISVFGNGVCNSADIEQLTTIQIKP